MDDIFEILFILARPAAGKSEILHYLKGLDNAERRSRFHIGKMHIIDDFPMLWTWFEEDDLLNKMGHPRLHTDSEGYFLYPYLWDLLIERMVLEYSKYSRDLKKKNDNTVIFEFSRGKEHGGYKGAFAHIPKTILKKAAIMYVNVSWEESLRKNRKRFNPDRPDSILEHGLSDDKLRALYFECDFQEINPDPIGFINIGNLKLPFINFENNDDVTTFQNKGLSKRLSEKLSALWNLETFR